QPEVEAVLAAIGAVALEVRLQHHLRVDIDVDPDGADALKVVRVPEHAERRVFLLPDFNTLETHKRRDVQVAATIDVVRPLAVPAFHRARRGEWRRSGGGDSVHALYVTQRAARVQRLQIPARDGVLRVHVP